jgi:hypothetical protein
MVQVGPSAGMFEVGVHSGQGRRHGKGPRDGEFIVEPQSGLKLRHSRFS